MPHIFISYAKIDTRPLAETLYEQINSMDGFSAWMDKSLESGESWALQIQDEIDKADLVLVLLSPDVNRRPTATQRRSFVLNEIDYAQAEHKPILPIMAQTTKMPVQIAGVQFLDFTTGNQEAALQSLLRRIERLHPNQEFKVAELAQEPTEPEIKVPRSSQKNISGLNIPLVAGFVSILAVVIAAFIFLPPLFNNFGAVADNPTPSASEEATAEISEIATEEVVITPTDSPSPTTEPSATNTDNPTTTPTDEPSATNTPTDTPFTVPQASQEDGRIEHVVQAGDTIASIAVAYGVSMSEILELNNLTDETAVFLQIGQVLLIAEANSNSSLETSDPLQAAIERARNFEGTQNSDWIPFFYTFEDGVEMALVPAGCFRMGNDFGATDNGIQSMVDGGQQCFDEPFWIDRYEVWQSQFTELGGTRADNRGFIGNNFPVQSITWFEARSYCELRRSGRLPTEAEWEYAARGIQSQIFPWGNVFIADNVVFVENSNGQVADVGSRLEGASWVGALDLSGNVWEWTSSFYQDYPYTASDGRELLDNSQNSRVLRGASWNHTETYLRSAARISGLPRDIADTTGFRCVRPLE